ncbi:hypothetical protein OKW96_05905 [Sphingobacterium sp. KU25419]|nr:hypothetical protein OKW96_05905 [Sphingobacterium sp. KU25419]
MAEGNEQQFAEKLLHLIHDAGLRKQMGQQSQVLAHQFSESKLCNNGLHFLKKYKAKQIKIGCKSC